MPKKPTPRGDLTRQAVLAAAQQLFIQQGYHGTSMRQIAELSGSALGGLYNHFPDGKEGIFQAIFLQNHPYQEILPALLQADGEDIETFLRDAANRLLKSLENRPDFLNLMFIEVVEFNSVHISQLFQSLLPQAIPLASRIVSIGGGRLRPIPLPILLRSFLGLFFSYYMTEVILAPAALPEFTENAMDHFINIYLHGILAR